MPGAEGGAGADLCAAGAAGPANSANTPAPFNAWLDRWLFLVLSAFMASGWWAADALAPCAGLVPWLLATIMVATSLRAGVADITRALRQPGPLLFILAVAHGVQPLLARVLGGWGFADRPEIVAGLVLTAAIPAGVTSVVWTGLAGGDVGLALTALTLDTLLSPLILPAVLLLFAGPAIEFAAGRLMLDLILMVVLPASLGIWLNERSGGTLAERAQAVAGPIAKLALGCVLAINLANSRQALAALPFPLWRLLFTVFGLVLAGYLGGALLARAVGLPRSTMLVVAHACGLRNLSAGIVICMRAFPPLTALPVLLGIFFQQPLAAVLRGLWQWLGPAATPAAENATAARTTATGPTAG